MSAKLGSIKLHKAIRAINKSALLLGSISTLAMSGAALAQEDGALMEEIEVTGIRGALKQGLDTKRFSDSVMDSVSAEDVGKFPDKNIGDALQRIPGVTVDRAWGEVSGVTIRGTAPQHSIVLLNGQNVASVGWFDRGGINRSFNFESLSSEQVAGMDIYKSTESNIHEGAIGGTVNLKTRKPLDMDAWSVYGSIEGAKNSNADDWTPSYSGLVSWKNDSETFGALVAHSYEEINVVRQALEALGGPVDGQATDSNGDSLVTPWGMGSALFDETRERTSSQITLQFAPTDALGFTLDYMNFGSENAHTNSNVFAIPGLNATVDADSVLTNGSGANYYGELTPNATSANGLVPLFNNTVYREPNMNTDIINLSMDFQGNGWNTDVVIGQSKATSRTDQTSTWWGNTSNPERTGYSYDFSGPLQVAPDYPEDLNNHSVLNLHQEMTLVEHKRDNTVDYAQADFNIEASLGAINSFDVGIKYQSQEFKNQSDNQNVDLNTIPAFTMADFSDGQISGLHGQDGKANTITSFAAVKGSAVLDYAKAHPTEVVVTGKYSIEEDITAAYAKANFEGESYRGNIGLRLVDTEVLSKGTIDDLPAKGTKEYTNFLPSANLAYDLSDELILRFAAGSTMSRPDYDAMQMAQTIQINEGTAVIGSPDLDPYRSDNYDIGLEWYFNDSSLMGATLFKKNISDYIETTTAVESLDGCGTSCRVTRSRNVGSAEVSGVELQYQQDFGNGFGVTANYTYTDSQVKNAAGQTSGLQGVSQNSYNVSAYFENEIVSARLAYNGRDEYIAPASASNYVNDPYDQVDASLIWHATDNLDISLEAVNIFNETVTTQNTDTDTTQTVYEFGSRYYLGASVKF